MKTLSELLAQVKEQHRTKTIDADFFIIAAPLIVEIVEKAIEQRDHYHAVCYRDLEPALEDESLRKRNAELDAIVKKAFAERE